MQSFTIDGIVVMPALEAEYRLDPTIKTLRNTITYEQGYSYSYHNFLQDVRDYSFNKSSNFYLTQPTNTVEFFEIQPIPFTYPSIDTTFLAFHRLTSDPLSALTANQDTCLTAASATSGSEITATSATSALSADGQDTISTYLTIDSAVDSDSTDLYKNINAEKFIDLKTKKTLPQNYYFNIMYIDSINCYIYHQTGDDRWYLSHKDEGGETLKFVKITIEPSLENNPDEIEASGGNKIKFQYTRSREGLIRFYKQLNSSTHVLKLLSDEDRQANPDSLPIRLEDMLDPDGDGDTVTQSPNVLELTPDTTLRTRPRYETNISKNVIQSHVFNYKKDINYNQLEIDKDKTSSQQVNTLVHSEYYFLTGESFPVNFFGLKNLQTPSNINSSNNIFPGQSNEYHRDYNKVFTGSNQTGGSSNISLEYTSSSKEYTFAPGMNYFNTPQDITPYNRVNINDTNLHSSGAIAGTSPGDSDKIYKKNAGYGKYTRWGDPTDQQLGTWLCTWLSGGDDPDVEPVWMDRYYKPDEVGYVQALTSSNIFSHARFDSNQFDVYNTTDTVIDRPSKLTLEPGCFYAYYRLTNKDLNNILSELDPSHIQKGFDTYQTIGGQQLGDADGTIELTGESIARATQLTKLPDFDAISINFDLNIKEFRAPFGHQVLGNYTTNGFGLFNTNDTSPFLFIFGSDGAAVGGVQQNSSLRVYDNSYKLYNYITNDSFIDDTESPSLFVSLIIRELPENLFILSENGTIIEASHDGVITSVYNLSTLLSQDITVIDTAYDEQLIYILSHTGTEVQDYQIHTFDMVSKALKTLDKSCLVSIPIPEQLGSNNVDYNYGRDISESGPPTKICIKNDPAPYQHHRSVYVGYSDIVKVGNRYIWQLVRGATSTITGLQVKHDVIYVYDTKTLELIPGHLTDNNLSDSTVPLRIADYAIDRNENIWLAHQENILSKYNKDRKLLVTREIEEQEILSLVLTRDMVDNEVQERVMVLGKVAGEEVITYDIGPVNHPTNDPDHEDYRKASPWTQDGNQFTRDRFTNPLDPVYDDLSTFDDTTQIIYPFMEGNLRFGEQTQDRFNIESDNTAGRVIDGEYEFITEGFDFIGTEGVTLMYGNIFDVETGNQIDQREFPNFSIDSADLRPQLVNHYEHTMLNYNRYPKHNLNLKMLLDPLFKQQQPDLVNLKIDLTKLNSNRYTDFHNFNIVIDNDKGCVEIWIDGTLDVTNHVYNFPVDKYRFTKMFKQSIVAGATSYLNDTLLVNKLSRPKSYTCKNTYINNFNIYTCRLKRNHILNIMRSKNPVTEMFWECPTRSRNYIDTIDKVFNHSTPPRKSNIFNIVVRNSSVRSIPLQNYLSNKITQLLPKVIPGDTKANNIQWTNELLDFTEPEADQLVYDGPVADQIIVDPSGVTLPAYLPYVLQ